MLLKPQKINTIDDYIQQFDEPAQAKLNELRDVILKIIPDSTQTMSYGIPTFKLKKNIIHFAYFKTHIGIYPGPVAIENFKQELKIYKTTKGAIHIPNNEPLPIKLINNIVVFNVKYLG